MCIDQGRRTRPRKVVDYLHHVRSLVVDLGIALVVAAFGAQVLDRDVSAVVDVVHLNVRVASADFAGGVVVVDDLVVVVPDVGSGRHLDAALARDLAELHGLISKTSMRMRVRRTTHVVGGLDLDSRSELVGVLHGAVLDAGLLVRRASAVLVDVAELRARRQSDHGRDDVDLAHNHYDSCQQAT